MKQSNTQEKTNDWPEIICKSLFPLLSFPFLNDDDHVDNELWVNGSPGNLFRGNDAFRKFPLVIHLLTVGKLTKNCWCCGAVMEYPQQYTSFICAVCKVTNDTASANSTITTPLRQDVYVLKLDELSGMIDRYVQSKDGQLLEQVKSKISKTFFSVPNVIASFAAKTQPILDTSEIKQFYRLMDGKSQSTTNAFMLSLDSLLDRPRFCMKSVDGLKFVLLMLLNPLFFHSTSKEEIFFHQKILQRLFGYISNSTSRSPSPIENEMILFLGNCLDAEEFEKIVGVVNFFITQRLLIPDMHINNTNVYSDWGIEVALKFQRLLVEANGLSSKLSDSAFYNSGLESINMVYDFESWRNSLVFEGGEHFYFCEFPFAISLSSKMRILNYESGKEQEIRAELAIAESLLFFQPINPFCYLKISRDRIIHDSLLQLSTQKSNLKKKLRVEFTDESGLDAGGLAKEWLLLLVRDLFNPIQGLFCLEEEVNFLWFCPTKDYPNKLEVYELCGIIIGLAMYNGVLLDLPLPLVCYKKLLGQPGTLEDLKEFKPDVYKNLKFLLNYENSTDFESTFSLNFSYYDKDLETTVDLYSYKISESSNENLDSDSLDYENSNLPSNSTFLSNKATENLVTMANRKLYVANFVDFTLNKRIEPIFKQFQSGFLMVCNGFSLKLFRPCEIESLVNGSKENQINVAIIRENSVYTDGFSPNDPIVVRFWEVFQEYDDKHRRNLLRFITGSDRLPCVGEASDFGIQLSCLGDVDSDRFPTAHTCFNQLCLYRYSTKQKLQEKLTKAIDECTGFDLR